MTVKQDQEAATPVSCSLHCKATAALTEEVIADLDVEDQSLKELIDAQEEEQEQL